MIDILRAARSFLIADSAVNALVSGRVFAGPIPKGEAESMPRACVTLRMAGGPQSGEFFEMTQQRIDAFCYGANPISCVEVQRAVQDAFKYMRRSLQDTAFLHSALPSGAIGPIEDPDTNWPVVVQSFLVLAAETALA